MLNLFTDAFREANPDLKLKKGGFSYDLYFGGHCPFQIDLGNGQTLKRKPGNNGLPQLEILVQNLNITFSRSSRKLFTWVIRKTLSYTKKIIEYLIKLFIDIQYEILKENFSVS